MPKYFGYTHDDGKKIEVKVYKDQWQLNKYISDPFILRVFGPFRAKDYDHAMKRLKRLIKHDTIYAIRK